MVSSQCQYDKNCLFITCFYYWEPLPAHTPEEYMAPMLLTSPAVPTAIYVPILGNPRIVAGHVATNLEG